MIGRCVECHACSTRGGSKGLAPNRKINPYRHCGGRCFDAFSPDAPRICFVLFCFCNCQNEEEGWSFFPFCFSIEREK